MDGYLVEEYENLGTLLIPESTSMFSLTGNGRNKIKTPDSQYILQIFEEKLALGKKVCKELGSKVPEYTTIKVGRTNPRAFASNDGFANIVINDRLPKYIYEGEIVHAAINEVIDICMGWYDRIYGTSFIKTIELQAYSWAKQREGYVTYEYAKQLYFGAGREAISQEKIDIRQKVDFLISRMYTNNDFSNFGFTDWGSSTDWGWSQRDFEAFDIDKEDNGYSWESDSFWDEEDDGWW